MNNTDLKELEAIINSFEDKDCDEYWELLEKYHEMEISIIQQQIQELSIGR